MLVIQPDGVPEGRIADDGEEIGMFLVLVPGPYIEIPRGG
jgi:hypothetical protein